MHTVAAKFAGDIQRMLALLDVMASSISLGKVPAKGLRSKHPLVAAALKLHGHLHASSTMMTVVNDGTYLTLCADFELTIRELIIRYVEGASAKCADYKHLPATMRAWYPRGCGEILVNLSQDRFKHLTQEGIHRSLASCLGSPTKPYILIGDAYVYNRRNFWPGELESHLSERLGIPKIWQKLSRRANFQSVLGSSGPAATEMLARARLDELLSRRNDIVHRGKSYYTASDSEVRGAAGYCVHLTQALAEVLGEQLAAI